MSVIIIPYLYFVIVTQNAEENPDEHICYKNIMLHEYHVATMLFMAKRVNIVYLTKKVSPCIDYSL